MGRTDVGDKQTIIDDQRDYSESSAVYLAINVFYFFSVLHVIVGPSLTLKYSNIEIKLFKETYGSYISVIDLRKIRSMNEKIF